MNTANYEAWIRELVAKRTIILIDDSAEDCAIVQEFTRKYHCDLRIAPRAEEGLRIARDPSIHKPLAFLDIRLRPGESSFSTFRTLKMERPKMPIVLISGVVDPDALSRMSEIGFWLFCQKPSQFTQAYFDDLFQTLDIPTAPGIT